MRERLENFHLLNPHHFLHSSFTLPLNKIYNLSSSSSQAQSSTKYGRLVVLVVEAFRLYGDITCFYLLLREVSNMQKELREDRNKVVQCFFVFEYFCQLTDIESIRVCQQWGSIIIRGWRRGRRGRSRKLQH